jgi:hypothetical protein
MMALAEAVAIMGGVSLIFGALGVIGCAIGALLDWMGIL